MAGIPDDHVVPVGTWSADVQLPNKTLTATLCFSSTGTVWLKTHGGAGTGQWSATGTGFRYRVHERFTGNENAGWIDIDQEAVQHGERFSSSGISTLHAGNGDVLEQVRSVVTASRLAAAEPEQPAGPASYDVARAPR